MTFPRALGGIDGSPYSAERSSDLVLVSERR